MVEEKVELEKKNTWERNQDEKRGKGKGGSEDTRCRGGKETKLRVGEREKKRREERC